MYPPQVELARMVRYFGTVQQSIRIPSAARFAVLLYFIRMEAITQIIPPHLLKWKTRLQANLAGHIGPTMEDVQHFTDHCRTKPPEYFSPNFSTQPSGLDTPSSNFLSEGSHYKLGSLTGLWQGSLIVSCHPWHPDVYALMEQQDAFYRL